MSDSTNTRSHGRVLRDRLQRLTATLAVVAGPVIYVVVQTAGVQHP